MTGLRPVLSDVVSRRTVVGGITASVLALAWAASGSLFIPGPQSANPAPISRDVLDVLRDVIASDEDAVVLGRLFLAENELASDAEGWGTLLKSRLNVPEALVRDDSIRDAVRQRIDEDLEAGEVLLLDGWLVSVTEAMLFAYAALLASY